jgi:EAL and modified HD-GYP domain-containing signal transduction protein
VSEPQDDSVASTGNRLAVLKLIQELEDPDVSVATVEKYVLMDPTLTLRLLRHINSSAAGLATAVDSIEHASVLVGLNTIRNWVMLLALADLDTARVEAIKAALVRGQFCRLIAQEMGIAERASFFTGGLMSGMAAVIGVELEEILADSALSDEIKYGALTRTGPIGDAIQLAVDLEEGRLTPWLDFSIPAERLAELYVRAIGRAVEATSVL